MYVFLHITFYNTIQRQDKLHDCFQTRVGPLLLISTCPRETLRVESEKIQEEMRPIRMHTLN